MKGPMGVSKVPCNVQGVKQCAGSPGNVQLHGVCMVSREFAVSLASCMAPLAAVPRERAVSPRSV